MERSKILMWVVVAVAAAVIVWRVGFKIPAAQMPGAGQKADAQPVPTQTDPNHQADPNESPAPAEPNKPADKSDAPDKPADPNASETAPKPGSPEGGTEPSEADKSSDPNQPADPNKAEEQGPTLEAVNLKDVEMKNIIQKIAEWTGKVVIPSDEAMKQKITIYAAAKMPRDEALAMIYSALRMKGYIAEHADKVIYLKPIDKAKLGQVPIIGPDEPLAAITNKDEVVQKLFRLKNYGPAQMSQVVGPLVADYGYVGADEVTSSLLVIDTVANLMRIEGIIKQFDVPEAEQAATEVIPVEHGDPGEIVQMLNILLGETLGRSRYYRERYNRGGYSGGSSRPSSPSRPSSGQGSSAVVISSGDVPIILIPEPRRKWIIVKGPAEVIETVREWIKRLDTVEPVESEHEIVQLSYADAREVESSIRDSFEERPGTEFLPSIVVQSLPESRQIMIVGRPDLRDMVKKMILELDKPPADLEEKTFDLKHADAEQIKQNIDNLFGDESQNRNRYDYYYYRYGRQQGRSIDTVKAIAFPTMNQVTVIASEENMVRIEEQIKLWDAPLDVEATKPRIIELQNSDPVQMAQLLTRLFTEEESGSQSFFRMIFWGDDFGSDRKKIVGPLYGQLTFEDVPGTKKIIVISKIPQAYDVVERLILELDREEMAEVPKVVALKYADPEDLSERLNAMFNEQGTTAPIRRSERGLSDYSMNPDDQRSGNNQNRQGSQQGGNPNDYTPWWSQGRRALDEEPISNVIGRVRFVPDPRSKSIMVMAPPEFMESIEQTIAELDVPGKQVMIKAVIVEVDHSDLTSLGLQVASEPLDAFGTLDENAVTALGQLSLLEERGSLTLQAGTNVTALVDLLVKKVNAKILNQQALWTKDNEEAMFFKGDNVAFQSSTSVSDTGGRVTSGFTFERVGMTLRVRPSITPEQNVDMIVQVLLSQLTGDNVNGQPVRNEMDTTTPMIVGNGQTVMLGGILFQTDSKTNRKIPLLGDIPLVGGLFQHNEVIVSNNELIVFITPYVIDKEENMIAAAGQEELDKRKATLDDVQRHLDQAMDRFDDPGW